MRSLLLANLKWVGLTLGALSVFSPASARADDSKPSYVGVGQPKKPADKADKAPRQGWFPSLNLGATFNLVDSRSVVGQLDGLTVQLGLKYDAGIEYLQGKHEWRTGVTLGAGLSRTPAIDTFIKSKDDFLLGSIYLFHARPWIGPFAKAVLQTSMFRGTDVRPAPVTYSIARVEGDTIERVADKLPLSDPFRPLQLRQAAGLFLQPHKDETLNVEARVGGGGRETFATNQLALADDDSTPAIEVKELRNVYQAGTELAIDVWGAVVDKRILYKAHVIVMTPFVHSNLPATDERGPLDLTNLDVGGTLSVKLVDWASIDYELKVVREPQLLDKFQTQNSLLLTLGVALGDDAPTK